ncbi:MAG TPA: galactose oxidase-like domain-containing protein, partial [Acidimicrobiia bacterium]|nr:galactose oxidase-like domain-containing protein [Acidimicrobiia bacterium]
GDTTLTATAPPSGNVAPPGTYYLVVNKRSLQGPIPSVARMVDVGRTDRSEAPRPFPDDAPAPSGGSATADEDTSQAAAVRQRARDATTGPSTHRFLAAHAAPAGGTSPVPPGTLLRRWPFVPR